VKIYTVNFKLRALSYQMGIKGKPRNLMSGEKRSKATYEVAQTDEMKQHKKRAAT